MRLSFEKLLSVLCRPVDDSAVIDVIGENQVQRFSYQGYVDLKSHGVSVMFKEAPWVIPQDKISDPKTLYVAAFHFHREGHERHTQYKGQFPKGVALNDSEASIISKFGIPVETGGGGVSTVLKKPISRWLRYNFDNAILQFQLDNNNLVELITLYTKDLQQGVEL